MAILNRGVSRGATQQLSVVSYQLSALSRQLPISNPSTGCAILPRELPFQAEIGPEDRGPPRVVFFVEREMAAAVREVRGGRRRRARTSPKVDDLGRRREQHPVPPRAYCRAEIHVLGVEKVALVEEARGFRGIAPDEQARPADPVDISLAPPAPLDPPRRN